MRGGAAGWCDHVRVPDGIFILGQVATRLAPARTYWLCIVMSSDGVV
jgi:hypothetical protein